MIGQATEEKALCYPITAAFSLFVSGILVTATTRGLSSKTYSKDQP